jgi:nucleoside 2-deoxyribosyltransferase
MKVYLAGPITGLNYETATIEREQITKALESFGITCVSPMRHDDMEWTDVFKPTCADAEQARRVVKRDSFDIRNCDAVLVDLRNTERVSLGTVWEMGFAYALDKPVFLVCDKRHEHAMTLHSAGWRCETIEEAVSELIALFKPYLPKQRARASSLLDAR